MHKEHLVVTAAFASASALCICLYLRLCLYRCLWRNRQANQREQEASRRKTAGGRWMRAGDSQQAR